MPSVVIDPIIAGRTVSSLDRTTLTSVRGDLLADIGIAPVLMAQSALNEMRRSARGTPVDPGIFEAAAKLFATAELADETVAEYERRVAIGTGLPTTTVRRCTEELAAEIRDLPVVTKAELPSDDLRPGYHVRWVPAGRVFVAIMASNHPVPNTSWVQALFHGYSVLVRPGSRDPFTVRRLVAALLAAGLPAARLSFLPCSHTVADFLLAEADRGIVYGGDQAVRRWLRTGSIAARGPGRTKALLDIDAGGAVFDHLAASASFDGGTRCNNLSAVFTSREVSAVAGELAARFAALPVTRITESTAVLPAVGPERAATLRRQVSALRAELTDHTTTLTGEDFLIPLGDGSFLPRPLVLSAPSHDHAAVGTELPFPFVVVAPWHESLGITPLRHSLVLNLLTDRADIVEEALGEPSIRKVTGGTVLPWTAVPGIPHDGNYTQFLLEPKGLVTAPPR